MIQKELNPIYLNKLDSSVAILDTSPNSAEYFNITEFPEVFTAGKNLIKLAPQENSLQINSPIYIEVVDSTGNRIYHEVLNYVGSDKSRAVSIYIYPGAPPGNATIYIASFTTRGESGSLILKNDVPNILWKRNFKISPSTKNSTEIIFTKKPSVLIKEKVIPYFLPDSTISFTTTATGSGTDTFELQSYIASENVLSGNRRSNEFVEGQLDISFKKNIQARPSVSGSAGISGEYITVGSRGNNVIVSNGFEFTKDMVGGTIVVRNANVTKYLPNDIVTPSLHNPANIIYSASIVRVIDSNKVEVNNPFKYTFSYQSIEGNTKATTINSFESSTNITCSYVRLRTTSSQTDYTASFAECIFTDIEPAAGSIYKIRTYYKPVGLFGDFIDNGETIVGPYNILRDENAIEPSIAAGYNEVELSNVESSGSISLYYNTTIYNMSGYSTALSLNNTNLIDGILIETGPEVGPFDYNDTSYTEFTTKITPRIYKDTQYSLRFNAYATAASPSSTKYSIPRIDIFLSGSKAIRLGKNKYRTGIDDTVDLTSQYGTYVGSVSGLNIRYNDMIFDFIALADGDIKPVFVVRSGNWVVSNLQIIIPNENGFSPNYIRFNTKIDPVYDNTEHIFKFQYFDYESRQAALETIVYGPKFNGGNTYSFSTVGGIKKMTFGDSIIASGPGDVSDWETGFVFVGSDDITL